MKKRIITIILVFFVAFFFQVDSLIARSGCCSSHGGVAGCSGGYNICFDGATSSCPCGSKNYGTSSPKTQSSQYAYYRNLLNNSKHEEKEYDLSLVVAIAVGAFIVYGFVKSNVDNKASLNSNYHSSPQLSEEERKQREFENFKSNIDVFLKREFKELVNAKILNTDTKLGFKVTTEVMRNENRGKVYFQTLSRDLHVSIMSKSKKSYKLCESSVFNGHNDIYASTKNVKIYDYKKRIRGYYNFTAKTITTTNIKKSKKIINYKTGIEIPLLFYKASSGTNVIIYLDLHDLSKLSKLCGNLEIVETKPNGVYNCAGCQKQIEFLSDKCKNCKATLDWGKNIMTFNQ